MVLDLFSQEELILPFQRIRAEFGEAFTQATPSDKMQERVFDAVLQATTEIMTPERFRRLRKDVQTTAKSWFRTRQKWAAALQFELGYLNGDQYKENRFLLAAFIGQIYWLGQEHKSAIKSKMRARK